MTRAAAAGFPRFQRRREGQGSLYLSGQGMSFAHAGLRQKHRERGTVTIPKLGEVAVRGGRWPCGRIVSARLRMRHEVWTLSVQFDAPAPHGRKAIGEPATPSSAPTSACPASWPTASAARWCRRGRCGSRRRGCNAASAGRRPRRRKRPDRVAATKSGGNKPSPGRTARWRRDGRTCCTRPRAT